MSPRRVLPIRKNTPHRAIKTNAWKLAQTQNGKRILVGLYIPPHAKTNCDRSKIFNSNYTKFRADQAIVRWIEGNQKIAYSIHVKNFSYELGTTVKPTVDFDDNIEEICSTGIHFFKSQEAAQNYDEQAAININSDGDTIHRCADTGKIKFVENKIHVLYFCQTRWKIMGRYSLEEMDSGTYEDGPIPKSLTNLFPSYPRWKDDCEKLFTLLKK